MDSTGQHKDRFKALMAEYDALDKAENPRRAAELLLDAGALVDRESEPKKWAAFRSLFGQFSEAFDPAAAIKAYRDALTVWDPVDDHDSWVTCHSGIGTLMVKFQPLGPAEIDEAITHLESAVTDQPFLSSLLAVLYRFRTTGDPLDNWQKRVYQLHQVIEQTSRDSDPHAWAMANNELAIALSDQPDCDFFASLKERIRQHRDSLDALDGLHDDTWIDTCLYLAECHLFSGPIDDQTEIHEAERYARLALGALREESPVPLRAKVLLTMAKVLLSPGRISRIENMRESLSFCDQAAALLDPDISPALVASVESFRANALLKLMQLGETGHEEQLATHTEAALALLPGAEHLRDRRSILQVAGEGMLAAGLFERASGYLKQALEAAGSALAVAESREGRMERIWEFRDSSALLAWCLLKLGATDQALVELEKGKGRFWQPEGAACTADRLKTLVPPGGALLIADFAGKEGVVVIVTDTKTVAVWLPSFGNERLMELQRGGLDASSLGGWLRAYSMRNSEHMAWRSTIDATGEILYRELWMPLVEALTELGVSDGAELVWFPQGGIGVFPVHAAWMTDENNERRWLLERYVVRYAPSASVLLSGKPLCDAFAGSVLLVANPCGDLDFSELECAWITRTFADRPLTILHGIDATPEAVLGQVPEAGIAHFSTHATFDLNRPLRSALLLAEGRLLALERLMPAMEGKAPQLVVLSACETAMSRVSSMPDEFLGFPAAFLHSGTRSVLATLWPVDDAATAVLSGRFYRELIHNHLKPARALREAQNWMRKATVRELMELLREMKSAPVPAAPFSARIRTNLRQFDPDLCPFAEPYFWAAFTISGKE
jgi:CHAT domain-containing protein/tetratricopeptide (TPR) repeat protein